MTVGLQFTGWLYSQGKERVNQIEAVKQPVGAKKEFRLSARSSITLEVGGETAWVPKKEAEAYMRMYNENYRAQGAAKPQGCKPTLIIVQPGDMVLRQDYPGLPTPAEWDELKYQEKKSKLSEIAESYEGLSASALSGNLKEDELNDVFDMFTGKITHGRAKYVEKVIE